MGSLASGRGGIDPAKLAHVKRLIGSGVSDREIARRVVVYRSVVAKIRVGQPPGKINAHGVVLVRCGDCGAMVIAPCRRCGLVALREAASQAATETMASDFRSVCGECDKRTTDLYFVHPATNRLTVSGRCPDCQELAVARAMRPAAAIGTTDFHIPERQRVVRLET